MNAEQATDAKLQEALIRTYEREIALLREQLRLTNDKMAERERQARWEVANDALRLGIHGHGAMVLERVRDANAPKD